MFGEKRWLLQSKQDLAAHRQCYGVTSLHMENGWVTLQHLQPCLCAAKKRLLQWRFDLKSFARSSFSGVKSLPAESSTNVNLGWFILLQTMGTPEIPNVSSHQHRSGKCWGRLVFTRLFFPLP